MALFLWKGVCARYVRAECAVKLEGGSGGIRGKMRIRNGIGPGEFRLGDKGNSTVDPSSVRPVFAPRAN